MKFIESFKELRKKQLTWWQWVVAAILMMIVLLLLLHVLIGPLIYTNDTESAPRGVYVVSPDQHLTYGDYVIVHAPVAIPDIKMPYDFRLLKRVAALPGDTYTVTDNVMATNGKVYPIYHRPWLPQLPHGTFSVPDGTMLFLNPPVHSLDSRYFGPIASSRVERKVFLLINYDAIDEFLYHFL